MAIDSTKKMTHAEWLREVDDDIRSVATETESQKKWAETASRLADALEHSNIGPTIGYLMANGMETDLYISGHLASCPSCTMIRKARKVDATKLFRPNNGTGGIVS